MNDTKREKPSVFGRFLFAAKNITGNAEGAARCLAAEQRTRVKIVFRRYVLLLAVGVAYLIFCRTAELSLPCLFHVMTGLDCPGCGITRLMLSLAEGDLGAVFHANEAIFILGPILCIFLLRDDLHWVLCGERKEPPRPFIFFLLIVFAAFTIWRNFLL